MSAANDARGLTFEERARQSLISSHARLGQFIKANNGVMIAAELELMLRRTLSAYGAQVAEVIARQVIKQERANGGWCVTCDGSPNRVRSEDGVMEAWPVCGECMEVVRQASARWDNESINDDEDAQ